MKSPNYPLNYPVDQFINYPLTVAEGKAIELTFTSMEIEECQELWIEWGRCPCDYVEVLDSDGSQLMKECSNVVPSPITSTGNTMSVIFYSDYSESMKDGRWWNQPQLSLLGQKCHQIIPKTIRTTSWRRSI